MFFASCSVPLQCTVLQGPLILQHCPCCCYLLVAAPCSALCYRGQHSDPLAAAILFALVCSALQCTVLQRVSTLILWHSCPCLLASAAFLCSALCCRGQLLILWHSCHVVALLQLLYGACVAEESADPLAQLYVCLQLPFAVHCVAEVSVLILWHTAAMFVVRSLQRSFWCALCCRGQHSDPLAGLCCLALLQ
jgi:hypothetical protein